MGAGCTFCGAGDAAFELDMIDHYAHWCRACRSKHEAALAAPIVASWAAPYLVVIVPDPVNAEYKPGDKPDAYHAEGPRAALLTLGDIFELRGEDYVRVTREELLARFPRCETCRGTGAAPTDVAWATKRCACLTNEVRENQARDGYTFKRF
jgi:hypothetical protein